MEEHPIRRLVQFQQENNPQSYRVYIEWVDGEGWKPVKVEELKENDKR